MGTPSFSGRNGRAALAGVFLVVLAGIVLFSILALFTSDEVSTNDLFVGFLPRKIAAEPEIGLIGGKLGDGFRHIYLGNVVFSKTSKIFELSKEEGPIEVARGVITSREHSVSFDNPSGEAGKLSFSVSGTNSFGLLIVRFNGAIVYSGNPGQSDKVEVALPKESMKARGNSIIFLTTSSGWRVWSPAYYTIEGMSIVSSPASSGSDSLVQRREFSLSKDELSSFVLGRVVFTALSATQGSSLSIKVNNMTIWKGPISENSLPVSIDFSSAGTALSERNEITFSSETEGRIELSGAEIIAFTSSYNSGTPAITFSLTKEEYDLLRDGKMIGKIDFSVREVPSKGTLSVSIVGDREKSVFSERVEGPSKVSITFGSEMAVLGKNLLVFSASDGGVFKAGDLDIRLERK